MKKGFRRLQKRVFTMLVIFIGIVLLCIIGCNRETRYKVLTFFFEGVPEPGTKKTKGWGSDKITVSMTEAEKGPLGEAERRAVQIDKLGQNINSRHDFSRDCAQCHMGSIGTGRQQLRTPLPELCYSCHKDLYKEGDYLHGPLNVGECVFCHDPHQAAYVHLQKAPQPDLCLRCHQKADIKLIPGHLVALKGICTDCHDPHGSPIPKLLKADQADIEKMHGSPDLHVEGDVSSEEPRPDTAQTEIGLSPDDPNIVN